MNDKKFTKKEWMSQTPNADITECGTQLEEEEEEEEETPAGQIVRALIEAIESETEPTCLTPIERYKAVLLEYVYTGVDTRKVLKGIMPKIESLFSTEGLKNSKLYQDLKAKL